MRVYRALWIVLIGFMLSSAGMAEWQKQVDSLIQSDSPVAQKRLINEIVASRADVRDIVTHIDKQIFPAVTRPKDGVLLKKSICIDGVSRPWALYIPTTYSPDKPTALLVVLHGGVSRLNIMDNPHKHAKEHYLTKLGEKHGWLVLFPSGQRGATWWDAVGMANISHLVHEVKRGFNVDDNRVWMAGFSDGGSGAFTWAMTKPTDFGAFIALNAHMAMGSLAGGLHTYPGNMAMTPVYAVTNDTDRLFPTREMAPIIEMAIQAGAKITYKKHSGGHDLSYGDIELPLIADFLEAHPRNPFPDSLVWESADSAFGRCRWFAIDEISKEPKRNWHKDYNLTMRTRTGQTMLLFRRDKPSAKVAVVKMGNHVFIKASRLKSFRVFVNPDMFDLTKPIVIDINGRKVFDETVKPNTWFLLNNYLRNRDRRQWYVNYIKIRL